MRKLIIAIDSGETTCASKPGKFCEYVGTKGYGTRFVCLLYRDNNLREQALEERDGWLQRAPQCIRDEHDDTPGLGELLGLS